MAVSSFPRRSAEPFFRIWKGDPSCTSFPSFDLFLRDILNFEERVLGKARSQHIPFDAYRENGPLPDRSRRGPYLSVRPIGIWQTITHIESYSIGKSCCLRKDSLSQYPLWKTIFPLTTWKNPHPRRPRGSLHSKIAH